MREGGRRRRSGSPGRLSLLFLISSLQIQVLSASEIIRYDGDVNIGKSNLSAKIPKLKCDKYFNSILKYPVGFNAQIYTCLRQDVLDERLFKIPSYSSVCLRRANVEIKIKSFSKKRQSIRWRPSETRFAMGFYHPVLPVSFWWESYCSHPTTYVHTWLYVFWWLRQRYIYWQRCLFCLQCCGLNMVIKCIQLGI